MARLQCRACGLDRDVAWIGDLRCPACRSTDTRAAIAVEELTNFEVARMFLPYDDEDEGIRGTG